MSNTELRLWLRNALLELIPIRDDESKENHVYKRRPSRPWKSRGLLRVVNIVHDICTKEIMMTSALTLLKHALVRLHDGRAMSALKRWSTSASASPVTSVKRFVMIRWRELLLRIWLNLDGGEFLMLQTLLISRSVVLCRCRYLRSTNLM